MHRCLGKPEVWDLPSGVGSVCKNSTSPCGLVHLYSVCMLLEPFTTVPEGMEILERGLGGASRAGASPSRMAGRDCPRLVNCPPGGQQQSDLRPLLFS